MTSTSIPRKPAPMAPNSEDTSYSMTNESAKITGNSPPTAIPAMKRNPAPKFELQKSFAHLLPEDERNSNWYGRMTDRIGTIVGTCGSVPCCVCCPNPYRQVREGQTGLVLKFGKYSRAVDPGLVKVNPLSERLQTIEVALQIVEVPQQVCMTKDNVNVHINSVIYYHVTNPYKAVFGISNIRTALMERTQTTLRHVLGARVLQEVIERREEVAMSIQEIIEETAEGWGVKVESILIKDINFSRELQESLSMAAQSKRIGESKVIVARAEVESAKLMRSAADILASPAAMQLRMLETYQAMAKTANAKVIFMPGGNAGTSGTQLMTSDQLKGDLGGAASDGFGLDDSAMRQTMHSQVIENI